MRCKNCGFENDNNLYICQNCGSPLYDENEPITAEEPTQQFYAAAPQNNRYNEAPAVPPQEPANPSNTRSIIVIIVLSLILVALIAGTATAVIKSKKAHPTVPNDSTVITQETKTETTTEKEPETTEKTEPETTEAESTEAEAKTFKVALSENRGGDTEGDGTYEEGSEVTVIAHPDDGYTFDGWYNGSKRVSGDTLYTFTLTENVKLKAVFAKEPETTEEESTTKKKSKKETTTEPETTEEESTTKKKSKKETTTEEESATEDTTEAEDNTQEAEENTDDNGIAYEEGDDD